MKKKFLILALAVFTVVGFSGCDIAKERIEQLRCEHVMDEGEITLEATCETVGEHVKTCTLCGYVETAYLPAIGHKWMNVQAVEPTCTTAGHETGIQCSVCNEWFVSPIIIPAKEHTIVTDEGFAPTCTEKGMTDGSHCSVCDEIIIAQEEIPATEHTIVTNEGFAPTCTKKGMTDGSYCSVCNTVLQEQTELPSDGHIDENTDDKCDVCMSYIPLEEGTYQEVALVNGMENIANKWVRVYKPSVVSEGLSNGLRAVNFINANYMCFNVSDTNITDNFSEPRVLAIGGMKIIETAEYFDFYFEVGEYAIFDKNSGDPLGILVIAENAQFDLNSPKGFYFLEPIEVE